MVPGSVILVGGDPGIGKSTLLLQICAGMANKLQDNSCFYISGEEAIDQVRIRAKRLGLADAPVRLASTTSVKDIIATLEKENPTLVIIDSIQTMYIDEVESTPGSVAQVRAAAYELIKLPRKRDLRCFWSDMLLNKALLPDRAFWNIWLIRCFILKATGDITSVFCVQSKTDTVLLTKSAF